MENLRKRVKVRLVNNAKNCKKWESRPTFVSQNIFSKIYNVRYMMFMKNFMNTGVCLIFSDYPKDLRF